MLFHLDDLEGLINLDHSMTLFPMGCHEMVGFPEARSSRTDTNETNREGFRCLLLSLMFSRA